MNNIWQKLTKPIFCLAPMEGVTDTVFRQVIASVGKPDLFFTEFTAVDGMFSTGRDRVTQRLKYSPSELPLIAQIWGTSPELFAAAAKEIVALGFDGIDINMGCPVRVVMNRGGGAGLINSPQVAAEIIAATKAGTQGKIPVSVKTRTGVREVITADWVKFLLEQDIAALTLHGRTAKQLSKVDNDWSQIKLAADIKHQLKVDTAIIGNGDVMSLEEAQKLAKTHNLDGIMIGRGIFQDPWFFASPHPIPTVSQRLDLWQYHLDLFESTWGDEKPFVILRKYFKIYAHGFKGAVRLREAVMSAETKQKAEQILIDFKSQTLA